MRRVNRHRIVAMAVVSLVVCLSLPAEALAVSSPWSSLPVLPEPVYRPGVASIGGTVYAVGGSHDYAPPSSSVYALDTATNEWTARAGLPAGVAHPMVVATGGSLFLLNGMTASGGHVSLRYDRATDTWARIRPLPTEDAGVAAATDDGRIFVVTASHAYRYRLDSNRWRMLGTSVPSGVSLTAGAVGPDGRVYVFGDTFFAWRPGGGWQRLPDAPSLQMLGDAYRPSVAWISGARLLVVGGANVDPYGNPYSAGQVWVFHLRSGAWTIGGSGGYNSAGAGGAVAGGSFYLVGGGGGYADMEGDKAYKLDLADVTPPRVTVRTYPTIAPYSTNFYGDSAQLTRTGAVPVAPLGVASDTQTPVDNQNDWFRTGAAPFRDTGWWPSRYPVARAYLAPGNIGQWQSRWTDSLGNAGSFSVSPRFSASTLDDASSRIQYSGAWHTATRLGDMARPVSGTLHVTTTPGASVRLTFTGRCIAFIAPQPSFVSGEAAVFIDGKKDGTAYLWPQGYEGYPVNRAIIYVKTWRQVGTHTVRLVANTGTVSVDAFTILK